MFVLGRWWYRSAHTGLALRRRHFGGLVLAGTLAGCDGGGPCALRAPRATTAPSATPRTWHGLGHLPQRRAHMTKEAVSRTESAAGRLIVVLDVDECLVHSTGFCNEMAGRHRQVEAS